MKAHYADGWRADVQDSTLNHQSGRDHENGQNGRNGQGGVDGRDIPVRIIRRRDPLVRVLPVRWEPGP